MPSYAVKWREPDGKTYLGRLELSDAGLVLDGRSGGGPVRRSIGFDELHGFHIGHGVKERLDGRPALVVERAGGDYLVASAVVHAGVLNELLHLLDAATL